MFFCQPDQLFHFFASADVYSFFINIHQGSQPGFCGCKFRSAVFIFQKIPCVARQINCDKLIIFPINFCKPIGNVDAYVRAASNPLYDKTVYFFSFVCLFRSVSSSHLAAPIIAESYLV
jgi:hypothetical protein